MKKLILWIMFVMINITALTSCDTADAVVCDNSTVDVVVKYGTPYYYDGAIVYYIYDGYYYYPHHNGTRWYYYRDRRPVRPHHNGWVNPGTQRPHKPHGNYRHGKPGTVRPKPNHGGHGGHHGGSGRRPSTPRRR